MISYCDEKVLCRRTLLSDYFSEKNSKEDCQKKCDTCSALLKYTKEANVVFSAVEFPNRNEIKITLFQLTDILCGVKSSEANKKPEIFTKFSNEIRSMSFDDVRRLIRKMNGQPVGYL